MERESIGRGVALQHKILALNNLNRKVHFGELKWLKSLISMTTFTKLPLFPAVDSAQPGDHRAAVVATDLEERVLVEHGLDDRPHLVDFSPVARDRIEEPCLAPFRIVGDGAARGKLVDRGGQVGQESARSCEHVLLALGLVV